MLFRKRGALKRPLTWWALSSTRARLIALGAGGLVLGLCTTSVIVWNSPANPIAQVAASISREDIAAAKILAERNSLLSQVIALQKRLSGSAGNLSATKAQLASIQQQLYSAQGALDSAAAAKTPPAAKAKPTTRTLSTRPLISTATASAVTAPSKAEIVNPSSRYFGMFTEQAPFSFSSFDATAKKIGSQPNAVGYFGGWDQTFRADVVSAAWKRNTLPILTWESRPINAANDTVVESDYSLPKIIGDPAAGVPGDFDAYLHQHAKDIVASGLPLGIRLDHEMNSNWYAWSEDDGRGGAINGNRPGDYVKMWQHVHGIFQEEGANSLVAWIWAPNIINNLPASHKAPGYLDSLFPGASYVDIVGLSGYLRPPYKSGNTFSFDYTFTPSLKELRRITDKPILLAEIGASETEGHKVAWITSLFQALARPENQDIIGFSWFNLAVTSYIQGERATNDWRIDSRPDSIAAFAAGLALPGGRFTLSRN